MRSEALAIMATRSAPPKHTYTSIRNVSVGRDSRAVRLIDTIFGLLPAVYGDPQLRQSFSYQQSRDIVNLSGSWIAKEFYDKHFCPVRLTRDFGGAEITLSDFLSEITLFGVSEQRNKVFFLQSDIGTGKTALINHIISKHGKDLFHKQDVWFLRLNVDVMRDFTGDDYSGFFQALEAKLCVVVTKLVERHGTDVTPKALDSLRALVKRHLSQPPATTIEARQARLRDDLIAISALLKRRLLLIVDNMDYIVHERDRFQFLVNKQDIDRGYLILIRKIVASFYQPGSMLSDIGANVLFMVRPDTYHLMKTTNLLVPMARVPFADNRYLFSLTGPSWDDVVSERAALLESCIAQIQPKGVADEIRRHTGPLIRSLHDAPSRQRLFRHLREISVYGLRGVLSFFSDYTWYPASNPDAEATVTTRFLQSYQLGLLAFMLNNKVIFTQNEANFPNLFFSNISPDEEEEEIVAPIDCKDNKRRINRQHWATYWLKRLLLEFIRTRNDSGASLKPEDVYNVFCMSDGDLSFTEDLVRLCLGSFSQTHVSDLIVVSREITGDRKAVRIENIELSSRAVHCLNELFDTFPYLQLVVDDYLMPLPLRWIREFAISELTTYGYLTAPHADFVSGAHAMVALKADRVTRFLALLAEAREAEEITKPKLFARLRVDGVKIPDVGKIFDGIVRELQALGSSGGVNVDVRNLRELFSKCRVEVRTDIRSAYGLFNT